MGKPEDYVEKYLMKQCKKLDFGCLKFTSSGTNGVPDRIVIGNGRTVFVETKRAGGVLRRLQREITGEMRRQGADFRVANTRELVDEILAEIAANPRPADTTGIKTPDITHLLREQLADKLPQATPEQIDELMNQAKSLGAGLNDRHSGAVSPVPLSPSGQQQVIIDQVQALAERWESIPALRRGSAARELREALVPKTES